jgi:hypothetical protein
MSRKVYFGILAAGLVTGWLIAEVIEFVLHW